MTNQPTAIDSVIEQIFNDIMEFPLYKENPYNMCLNQILKGIAERQTGSRKIRLEHDFGDSIYNFCTFVVMGETFYDDTHNEMRTDIIDEDEGYVSFHLWESDLTDINGCNVTIINEKPVKTLFSFFDDKDSYEGKIFFLKYWEKVKFDNYNYRMCYRFSDKFQSLNQIRENILDTQIFVYGKLLEDPLSFLYCKKLQPFLMLGGGHGIDDIAVSIFNSKFRIKVEKILNERKSLLNK